MKKEAAHHATGLGLANARRALLLHHTRRHLDEVVHQHSQAAEENAGMST